MRIKNTNKKINSVIIGIIMMVLITPIISAHGSEDFTEAERIIQQKIPCEQLTDEQLELIGDYYMEQMHPGEQHEMMDEMMGGESSETLKQMHIRMAKNFYCGEHETMNTGMMNMMMGNAGMMNNNQQNNLEGGRMMNYGMMGGMTGMGMMSNWGSIGMIITWLLWLIIFSFIFGIIFWWTYKLIVPEEKKTKKRKEE